MEQQTLHHDDSIENQNQDVNSGASTEDQTNTEVESLPFAEENHPAPESATPAELAEPVADEPAVETESATLAEPVADEPAAETESATPAELAEPVADEPTVETESATPAASVEPVADELAVETESATPAASVEPVADESAVETTPLDSKQIASELISEIDCEVKTTESEEEEDIPVVETLEQIEGEYKDFDLEQCVAELERLVGEPKFNLIKQRVGVLRAKCIEFFRKKRRAAAAERAESHRDEADQGVTEPETVETDDVEARFNAAFLKYKSAKAKFIEEIEEQKLQNLNAKNQIIEELKKLVESESTLKILNDKFKELQEQWKSVGPVPQNESANLWQNYHFYVEKFFDILRINKEMRSLDLKKNLECKVSLCEKAESLLLVDSISQSFKELQTLHEQWKEIGPVPDDKKEEVWERFKIASDQINQRRKEYYIKLFEEEQNNYNAKVVLCEQVEDITSRPTENVREYNNVSEKLVDMLNIWKTLGPAPAKLNDEIWGRFKSTLDKFFQQKKEFFQQVKDSQMQNYNQKLNLAIQAEGIAGRTDWKEATRDIINLQAEWKKIGTAPRKYSDYVWKRFRAACDKFFEAKSHYFSNIKEVEAENLKLKEEIIRKILSHEFGDDRNANLDIIKEYQNEWLKVGYVPKKDKDRIYTAYRDAINKRFAELKISADDVKHNRFRSKIDEILSNPDAARLIEKERHFLMNKVAQLKEDINLWENNLGFFAKSKNADIITNEFRQKIDKAKKEVEEIEYKIEMINKPQNM